MAKFNDFYFFEDSNYLLIECTFAEFGGYCIVGQVVDSADLSFFICKNPHQRGIFIIEDDGVRDIEFKFMFMNFFTRSQGEKLVEVQKG